MTNSMQRPLKFTETIEKAHHVVNEKVNKATKNPALSVVMLVYNGEKYLAEAIDSVLNQTFTDYEFIIINDGSTDRSQEIITTYKDDRIRLINNETNRGIPYNRNLGLQKARGEFLAWFDCDDLLLPTRFEKQIRFLRENEQYGLCGSWLLRFAGAKTFVARVSKHPEIIKAKLLFKPSIPNATAMYRLSMIRKFGLVFNNDLPISEDYDFYLRCSKHFPMTNLQEVLYKYRASETSIIRQFQAQENRDYNIQKVIYTQALNYVGLQPTESDFRLHSLVASEKLIDDFYDYKACFNWLLTIQQKAKETKVYDFRALNQVLAEEFLFVSKKSSKFGWRTLRFYFSHYRKFAFPNCIEILKLCARCIMRHNKF